MFKNSLKNEQKRPKKGRTRTKEKPLAFLDIVGPFWRHFSAGEAAAAPKKIEGSRFDFLGIFRPFRGQFFLGEAAAAPI